MPISLLSPLAARRMFALVGGVAVSFLVGCGDDPKQRVALLEQENQDLRGRNSQLESQLNEANAQRALLERRHDEPVPRPGDDVHRQLEAGAEVLADAHAVPLYAAPSIKEAP